MGTNANLVEEENGHKQEDLKIQSIKLMKTCEKITKPNATKDIVGALTKENEQICCIKHARNRNMREVK